MTEDSATLLKRIVDNTSPKFSTSIAVSDNKTDFTTRFNPPIELDRNRSYEMALVNLETYYSFPNIDSTINHFKYSPDSGTTWYDFRLPVGCYILKEINDTIQQKMKINQHDEKGVIVSANSITLKSILKLADGYQVDFSHDDSIGKVLGFNSRKYINAYNESEKLVDILNVNSILINADIISGSYLNGSQKPIIYSFFPNVDPGHKIVEKPNHPLYLPVHPKTIATLKTVLTDQNGKKLDLRGERVTIRYHLREL